MDEPRRRFLHRFKHGESVQRYRGEFGFIFITLLRTKNAQIHVTLMYDVDCKYGKILDFRIDPKLGLIQCSKGDKTYWYIYVYVHAHIHAANVQCTCQYFTAAFGQHLADDALMEMSQDSLMKWILARSICLMKGIHSMSQVASDGIVNKVPLCMSIDKLKTKSGVALFLHAEKLLVHSHMWRLTGYWYPKRLCNQTIVNSDWKKLLTTSAVTRIHVWRLRNAAFLCH